MIQIKRADDANLLAAALDYARRGWYVFPCHVVTNGLCSCGQPPDHRGAGKHPRTPNGHLGATLDEAIIRGWWTRWPMANVGIACLPSGLIVLDVDPRHGGLESLADLRQELGAALFETVCCETGGGGLHLYYSANGLDLPDKIGLLPGLDVKSQGYVIAPPSLHPSGGYYGWAMDSEPGL